MRGQQPTSFVSVSRQALGAEADFVYPATRGVRPADFGRRIEYNIALVKLAAQDAGVHKLLAEVSHLLKPQSALREPDLAARVMSLA
jgi:hypothetical protein